MKTNKKRSPLGKFFGSLALATITLGVFIFLASHSLNFFQFTFSEADQVYSYLGILLTSGGAVGWLVIFMYHAETVIQKGTSLIMMVVALLAELVTAVFDMQTASLYSQIELLPEELKMMTTVVGVFGLLTGLALVAYTAGDKIKWAFSDDDGDGKINVLDTVDDRQNRPQRPQERPQATQPSQQVQFANEGEKPAELAENHPTEAGKR